MKSAAGGKKEKRSKLGGHTIFSKFVILILISLILTAFMFGTFTYVLIDDFLVKPKTDDLCNAIADMERLWLTFQLSYRASVDSEGKWISRPAQERTEALLNDLIERMAMYEQMLDLYIYIADTDGEIQYSYPFLTGNYTVDSVPSKYLSKSIEEKLLYYNDSFYFSADQYAEQIKSKEFLLFSGDYYGLYSSFEDSFMTISKSLIYPDTSFSRDRVAGLMVVSVPFSEVSDARNSIIVVYLLMTVVLIILEFIVLYRVTKRITRPIVHLKEAAHRLAKGNFQELIPHSNGGGEVGELVTVFNDMTLALESMDKMKNDFIANVSHELRTPMTSIGGFIDAIRDGVVPEEKVDYYLGVIREEISRMNSLVNDLLDLARIQAGTVVMEREKCEINSLITNTVIKLEPLITKKNLQIEFNFSENEYYAYVDRKAISRVLINLVQNATKFTPEEGTITIGTNKPDGQDVIEVFVEDTGIGISPEDCEKIFDRFYKSDKSRGLDKTGTGLGLSIVSSILRAHGQDIRVESTLGKGATFIFTLPCSEISKGETKKNEGK